MWTGENKGRGSMWGGRGKSLKEGPNPEVESSRQ